MFEDIEFNTAWFWKSLRLKGSAYAFESVNLKEHYRQIYKSVRRNQIFLCEQEGFPPPENLCEHSHVLAGSVLEASCSGLGYSNLISDEVRHWVQSRWDARKSRISD